MDCGTALPKRTVAQRPMARRCRGSRDAAARHLEQAAGTRIRRTRPSARKSGSQYFYWSWGQLIDKPRFKARKWIWISFSPAWISFSSGLEFLQPGLEFLQPGLEFLPCGLLRTDPGAAFRSPAGARREPPDGGRRGPRLREGGARSSSCANREPEWEGGLTAAHAPSPPGTGLWRCGRGAGGG